MRRTIELAQIALILSVWFFGYGVVKQSVSYLAAKQLEQAQLRTLASK